LLLTAEAGAQGASQLPPLDAATRLLVVAPHPDDETLCCAGIIQRVLRAGGRASVVWITSGDGTRLGAMLQANSLLPRAADARALGARRMVEARAAAAVLGVPPSGQLFLGYPDGGVPLLLSRYRAAPYTSPMTGVSAVPYAGALFPGHPYTGESLERDFGAVLDSVRPTLILAPGLEDSHPDHRATGELTISVARGRALLPQVRFWVVHGGVGWPSPRELLPGVPLTPAPLAAARVNVPFELTPAEEDRKLQALEDYRTQMRTIGPFLVSFVRTNELLSAP
jgi:LmbE family N-acetylglucosaminyl deacetylase